MESSSSHEKKQSAKLTDLVFTDEKGSSSSPKPNFKGYYKGALLEGIYNTMGVIKKTAEALQKYATAITKYTASQSSTNYGTDVIPGRPAAKPTSNWNIPGPGFVTPIEDSRYRAFQYQIGYNYSWLPRSGFTIQFPMLRAMANNCELVRMAIQMRKDQVRGLDWDITVKPGYDPRKLESQRQRLREFFEWPDTLNDMNFNDFLSRFLEDLLILDAAAVGFHKDRAQRIYGMTQVDGATIKPFMDQYGFVPLPPDPAYGQVLFGRIMGTFTRDEMLYCQYNPQSDSPYGKSPVEMVITSAHISLRRQLFHLSYYSDGNVPDYIIPAPADWGSDQIRQVQEYLDSYLSGNNAARHKMKLIPAALSPKELRQPDFTTQIDEWLARIVGAMFGVAPFLLLKAKDSGGARASLQTITEQQADIGLKPLKQYLAETFTTRIIHQRFKQYGLQFSWLSEQRLEAELNLKRAQTMIPVGAIGIDEMRVAEGKAPLGVPPYIQMSNGVLFLTPKVVSAINQGVDFIGPMGGMDITQLPSGQTPSGGTPGKTPPLTTPSINPEEAPMVPQESGDEDVVIESVDDEAGDQIQKALDTWRRFALNSVKKHKSVQNFNPDPAIPIETANSIALALAGCFNEQDVKRAFDAIRD